MIDICCIGHITLDHVVTPSNKISMAGGTSYYFSHALAQMPLRYKLITALGTTERSFIEALQQKQIDVTTLPSKHTVHFENTYDASQDNRTQRVLQTADPFSADDFGDLQATIFHLGPLLANDIPVSLIQMLASRGQVSLDVQGYLRKVEHHRVLAVDWTDKLAALPFIHTLKANEHEMAALTHQTNAKEGAQMLHAWGVKEVVITLGSRGSIVYFDNEFFDIPAYVPSQVVDATGCGDTYMAGYLLQRLRKVGPKEAGAFGAAMATLKIQSSGPFTGNEQDIAYLQKNAVTVMPS